MKSRTRFISGGWRAAKLNATAGRNRGRCSGSLCRSWANQTRAYGAAGPPRALHAIARASRGRVRPRPSNRHRFGFAKDPAWISHRDALRAEVCEKGFDATMGAFSRAYGSQTLDASCLLLPMVGFLPADDPRIVGTVHAIRSRLSEGPYVYRYDARLEDDGVGGAEGAFLPCSFWLADSLILQRREDEAAAIFESVVASANDVGLCRRRNMTFPASFCLEIFRRR